MLYQARLYRAELPARCLKASSPSVNTTGERGERMGDSSRKCTVIHDTAI
jgi:hypothetical protein